MNQIDTITLRVTLMLVIDIHHPMAISIGWQGQVLQELKGDTFSHYFNKALIKVLGFYQNFSRQFDQHMKLTYNLRKYRPLQ